MKKFKQFITEQDDSTLSINQLEVGKTYEVVFFNKQSGMRNIPGTNINFKNDTPVIFTIIRYGHGEDKGIFVEFISHKLNEIFHSPDEDFTYLDDLQYAEHEALHGNPAPHNMFFIQEENSLIYKTQFREVNLTNATGEILRILGTNLF